MGVSISKLMNKEYDETLKVDETTMYYRKLEKLKEEMTGWERVKAIFENDVFGDMSPQLTRCKDASLVSWFVGMAIGGFGRSRISAQEFKRANLHEKFETPQFAQKALQDKLVLGFGEGAFKIGWRLCLFTFMFTLTSSCIAAYRGKSGIADQVGGGSVAGFLYKLRDGPKASMAGLAVGASLGLVAGTFTYLGAKMVGKEPDDLLRVQFQKTHQRNQDAYDRQKAQRHIDMSDDLTQFHEHFMATDELSMSKVKKTPIGQLTEAVKQKKVSPYPYRTLPPESIAVDVAAFDEALQKREAKEEAEKQRRLIEGYDDDDEEDDEDDAEEEAVKQPISSNTNTNNAAATTSITSLQS